MVKAPVVLTAPHRLLFLVGTVQFSLVVTWWGAMLLDLGGMGPGLEQPIPASLLHAPIMLFLVLPAFFFGFLLTVFPRWTGFPDAAPVVYVPVGMAFLLAAIMLWIGLLAALPLAIVTAFGAAATGWIWALSWMLGWLVRELRAGRSPTWHGWSILAALCLGLGCLIGVIAGLRSLDGMLIHMSNLIALALFILPVFVTVCHRMVPFFAGNVVTNYSRWRPFWVLAAFWIASLAGTGAYYLSALGVAAACNAVLACLTGLMLWKWWPGTRAPGLLWVLILGFAWAPVGFAWIAWSGLFAPESGRGGIHLLTMGFAGSLVIAMVTRVSEGHSGRPLTMPALGWIAFALVQVSTVLRLAAALSGEALPLLILSAFCLAAGLSPWAVRAMAIYVRPRVDGKAG